MEESNNETKRCADDALKIFAEAAVAISSQSPTTASSTPVSTISSSSKTAAPTKPKETTEVERKRRERRLMMNRITARERRKRKRELIDELQETVKVLTAKNESLTESNRAMKRRLAKLEGTNRDDGENSDITEQCVDGGGSSHEAVPAAKLAPTNSATVAEALTVDSTNSEVPTSMPAPSISVAAAAKAAQARLEYQTKMGLVRDMLSGVGSTSVNRSLPFLQLQQSALGGLAPFLSTPSSTLLSALTGASSACAPPKLGLPQSVLGAAAPLMGKTGPSTSLPSTLRSTTIPIPKLDGFEHGTNMP